MCVRGKTVCIRSAASINLISSKIIQIVRSAPIQLKSIMKRRTVCQHENSPKSFLSFPVTFSFEARMSSSSARSMQMNFTHKHTYSRWEIPTLCTTFKLPSVDLATRNTSLCTPQVTDPFFLLCALLFSS